MGVCQTSEGRLGQGRYTEQQSEVHSVGTRMVRYSSHQDRHPSPSSQVDQYERHSGQWGWTWERRWRSDMEDHEGMVRQLQAGEREGGRRSRGGRWGKVIDRHLREFKDMWLCQRKKLNDLSQHIPKKVCLRIPFDSLFPGAALWPMWAPQRVFLSPLWSGLPCCPSQTLSRLTPWPLETQLSP